MRQIIALLFCFGSFIAFSQEGKEHVREHEIEYELVEEVEEVSESHDSLYTFAYEGIEVPVMPGCESTEDMELFQCFQQQITQHIIKTFSYPEEARQAGEMGKVWIHFIIEKDGSVTNVEVARSSGSVSIDKEAVRTISTLPQMSRPAHIEDKPVRMSYTVPINARFQ